MLIESRCCRAALLLVPAFLLGLCTSAPRLGAQQSPDAPTSHPLPRGVGAWARVPQATLASSAAPGSDVATVPPEPEAPRFQHEPVSAEPWSYVPAPEHGHCLQTYRLYLPPAPHEKPPEGWPVVVQVKLSGFRQTPDTPVIDDASFLADLLREGIAVVVARVTPSLDTDDPLWFRTCDGALPDIPGHGLFHAPGNIPQDLAGTGIAPYDDHAYAMAEKDAVMLLQHVRFAARQQFDDDDPRADRNPDRSRDRAMSQLDHRMIGVHGVSAGGMALMWAALGPDRRDESPFAGRTGQWAETSRPDLAAFERAAVWWPAFHADVRPPTPHFGMFGHSTIPAQTIGACAIEDLIAASPLAYGDPEWIASLPLYLSYDEPSHSTSYEPEAAGCAPLPFCFPGQGREGVGLDELDNEAGRRIGMHPAWSGYAWKTRYPHTRLVVTDPAAYAQRGDVQTIAQFGAPGMHSHGKRDLVMWFVQQFGERRKALASADAADAVAGRWRDVGYGLSGSRGVPQLDVRTVVGTGTGAGTGTGTASATGTASGTASGPATATATPTAPPPTTDLILTLTGALENAPVILIGGPGPRHASLAGGVVVPQPTRVSLGHRTDATGSLEVRIPGPGPGIDPGDTPPSSHRAATFQMLIVDPAAPEGFAFTNARTLQAQDPAILAGTAAAEEASTAHR